MENYSSNPSETTGQQPQDERIEKLIDFLETGKAIYDTLAERTNKEMKGYYLGRASALNDTLLFLKGGDVSYVTTNVGGAGTVGAITDVKSKLK
jgi:hypothetical protein